MKFYSVQGSRPLRLLLERLMKILWRLPMRFQLSWPRSLRSKKKNQLRRSLRNKWILAQWQLSNLNSPSMILWLKKNLRNFYLTSLARSRARSIKKFKRDQGSHLLLSEEMKILSPSFLKIPSWRRKTKKKKRSKKRRRLKVQLYIRELIVMDVGKEELLVSDINALFALISTSAPTVRLTLNMSIHSWRLRHSSKLQWRFSLSLMMIM